MTITTLLLVWAATAPAETTEILTHDFRRAEALPRALRLLGPTDGQMKLEQGGLRITLPAKRTDVAPIGVAPRFGVPGNFEVSASFEILSLEGPSEKNSAGVSMHLGLRSSNK